MNLEKIIQEKWTSPIRKGYVTVNGCMLPERYKEIKNDIDQLEVYDSDIWVCSFPKCGTTWTQEMVWLIANNLDFKRAQTSIDERFPFLERTMIDDLRDIIKDNPNLKLLEGHQNSTETVKFMKPPRFIKTHLPLDLCPLQLKSGVKKPKIIYVSRDPRDACVSYFNHSKIMDGFSVTFDEFCELYLAGKVMYGSYWDNVLPFWKLRNQPNVLFLKYEDMKKDLGKVIQKTAEFLDCPLNDNDVERLTNYLSFDSMKKNPAVNREQNVQYIQQLHKVKYEGKFMRKGITGDYKNVMNLEIIDKFDKWIKKNTEGTDYFV